MGAKVLEIEGGLIIGQSNAGYLHGEPGGPKIPRFDPQCEIYMLAGMAGGSLGEETAAQFATEIEPYSEPLGLGQSPAGMMGYASYLIDRGQGCEVRPLALHSSHRGSSPLGHMFPGSGYHLHENAVEAQIAFVVAFAKRGIDYRLKWVDIIQGEGGPFTGYAELFRTYVREVVPMIAAASGSPPPSVIFSQINSFTNALECNSVALEQFQIARELAASNVFLTGPMYQYPFHDPGHLTDVARMMHGEVRALILQHAVRDQKPWNPLWPATGHAQLIGDSIRLEMKVPPGTVRLSFDNDWVPDVPNKGFLVFNQHGSAAEIRSVEIDGTYVLIRLGDGAEISGGKLEYATYNSPNVVWWASGRGLLYAETDVPSPYHAMGFPIPKLVRHYCVTFSLPLAIV